MYERTKTHENRAATARKRFTIGKFPDYNPSKYKIRPSAPVIVAHLRCGLHLMYYKALRL
jgi:hypothetical protein